MRFANLDKLRGFASISVVVYHVIELTNWSDFPVNGPNVWWRIGWMGVDLFFVLSGFVIFYSAHSLHGIHGDNWWKVYSVHRLARIAPLYFFTLLIFTFLIVPGLLFEPYRHLFFQAITHALFIHNWFPSTQGAINGVNWSIGVEMQFYVFVLVAFRILNRASPLAVLLSLWAIACIWKAGIFFLLPTADSTQRWFLSTQLPGVLDEFAFGIVTCKLMLSHKIDSLPIVGNRLFRVFLAMIMIWITLRLFWATADYWNSAWLVVFFHSLTGLCGALLIFSIVALPEYTLGLISRFFDYLGTVSYGIYLWHLPVILSLKRLDLQAGSRFLIVSLVATLAFASFSYYMLERPWIKWAKAIR